MFTARYELNLSSKIQVYLSINRAKKIGTTLFVVRFNVVFRIIFLSSGCFSFKLGQQLFMFSLVSFQTDCSHPLSDRYTTFSSQFSKTESSVRNAFLRKH